MRQILISLLLLIAIVGGAWLLFKVGYQAQPRGPAQVRIEHATGQVSVQNVAGNHDAERLEILPEGSRVITGEDGFVRLVIADGEAVELNNNSDVLIEAVTIEGVDFKLKQGQIEATVKRFSGRRLGVRSNDEQVSVGTKQGRFTALANSAGGITVAAHEGEVTSRTAQGTPSPIPQGERRVFGAGGKVLAKGAIPESVLLKVNWPEVLVQRSDTVKIRGEVDPGSRLTIAGKEVALDDKGLFEADVALTEGENQVTVTATGLGQPAVSISPLIIRDTRPPTVSTQTDEIWK